MFGKRPPGAGDQGLRAPPPAPAGGVAVATRPQRVEPGGANESNNRLDAVRASQNAAAAAQQKAAATPKATPGLAQLHAAQPATAEVVREQSDYYHATKTTIFNALLNTIDLSQLAQLDIKAAAEEIKD